MTDLSAKEGKVHGIDVRIRFDGNQYFVSDDPLDLYGVGSSIEEARNDYWLALQEYYAHLSEAAGRLAGHLEDDLAFLHRVFEGDESSCLS